MTIGALVDIGVDFDHLKSEIGKLPIDGFELSLSRTVRANISAAKFDVHVKGDHGHHAHGEEHTHAEEPAHGHSHDDGHVHRKASEIIRMVKHSPLARGVKDRAVAIFHKLAIAEGQVHQMPPEDVEFHEVGAIDSIVDVVGTAIGLEALEVEHIVCSPINVGAGFIHCQHGIYPTPAPATANLLTDATVYSKHAEVELVTPTGAAILAASVDRFGALDNMWVEKVGYGAGTKDLGQFPNCLRLFAGRVPADSAGFATEEVVSETVVVIETNIDDMSAEGLAYAAEILIEAGALDVVMIPALMKKGRPGHLLQILVAQEREHDIVRQLFRETTTIGVRRRVMERSVLGRDEVAVSTPEGTVHVKVSRYGGQVMQVSPEYEDCRRLARSTGHTFEEIRSSALRAYGELTDAPRSGRSEENG